MFFGVLAHGADRPFLSAHGIFQLLIEPHEQGLFVGLERV
jgi:hypothetical protein